MQAKTSLVLKIKKCWPNRLLLWPNFHIKKATYKENVLACDSDIKYTAIFADATGFMHCSEILLVQCIGDDWSTCGDNENDLLETNSNFLKPLFRDVCHT